MVPSIFILFLRHSYIARRSVVVFKNLEKRIRCTDNSNNVKFTIYFVFYYLRTLTSMIRDTYFVKRQTEMEGSVIFTPPAFYPTPPTRTHPPRAHTAGVSVSVSASAACAAATAPPPVTSAICTGVTPETLRTPMLIIQCTNSL